MSYTAESVEGFHTFGERVLSGEWSGPSYQLCDKLQPPEDAETQKTDYSAGDPTLQKIRSFVNGAANDWETQSAVSRRANLLGTHTNTLPHGAGHNHPSVELQKQVVNLVERATQYQLKKMRPYVIPERESP